MRRLLIIFNGESNSGGFARNSSATTAELAPRDAVRVLNPVNLQFEDLDIGTNNLLDHAGLDLTTHGWELELANYAALNKFNAKPVYLCKTGQGGSTIDQWVQSNSAYWQKFLERINAAKTLLAGVNYIPIVWFTQGINDAMNGTPTAEWKTKVIQHFGRIRTELPGVKILFCQPPPNSTGYSTWLPVIDQIVTEDPNIYLIPSNATTKRDVEHWDYDGMKAMSKRLCEKTISLYVPKRKFTALIPTWRNRVLKGGACGINN